MTTTQPRPTRNYSFTQAERDARALDGIREHLDREERGGATVMRIDTIRRILATGSVTVLAAAVLALALTGCQDAPARPPSTPTATVPRAVQQ